jgi:GcrA cell cycle regulator
MPADLPQRLLAWLARRDWRVRAGGEAEVLQQLGLTAAGARAEGWMATAWAVLAARGEVRVRRGGADGWAGEWLAVLVASGAVHRSAGAPLAWGEIATGSGEMFEWTEAKHAQLDALWAEGATTARIAEVLGTTKNAVVGKVRRRGLEGRPSPIKGRGEGAYYPRARPVLVGAPRDPYSKAGAMKGSTLAALGASVPAVAVRPVIEAPPPRPAVVIPALSRRPCCWPLWGDKERPTHRYCEAPGVPGKSYCAAHGALAWVRQEARSPAQLEADESRRLKQLIAGQRRAAQGLPWRAL